MELRYMWHHNVVADLFDEEYIVAQLNTGMYYSVQGEIVELLSRMPFVSATDEIKTWASELSGESAEVEEAMKRVQAVWERMETEELIIRRPSNPKGVKAPVKLRNMVASHLAKYGDMKDLLALDIIHDVDDEGWPEIDTEAEKGADKAQPEGDKK
jgi:hypothetical protein